MGVETSTVGNRPVPAPKQDKGASHGLEGGSIVAVAGAAMRPTPVAGAHAPSASAPSAEPACPYVGPEPFQEKDAAKFFGRDVESVDLMFFVLANAEVLFYAQSGTGKTSLINAKLIPLLKEKECKVLPVARVKGPMNLRDPSQIKNLFVFNVLARWTGEPVSPALAEMTLKEYLVNFAKDMDCDQENPPLMVAIFDQFEELFTAYPERWQEREPFFLQVREALQSLSMLRVVFAMREDYVASMDPYIPFLPERLRTRFRLEKLCAEAALEAIVKPLEGTGCEFEAGVAEHLVDDLLKVPVPSREGELKEFPSGEYPCLDDDEIQGALPDSGERGKPDHGSVKTEFVEPVQLQVVCKNIWENLNRTGESIITDEHLRTFGDVTRALSEFYERCLHEAAGDIAVYSKEGSLRVVKVTEGEIRRFFEDLLITKAGTRGLVYQGRTRTGWLPNEVVKRLEDRHLVRGEDRGGSRWIELIHDRFIEPILESNHRWRNKLSDEKRLNLESKAASWAEKEDPGMLLRGVELTKAEAWMNSQEAAELGYSELLERFIDVSHADQEKRTHHRRVMRIMYGTLVIALFLAMGWCNSRRLRIFAEMHAKAMESAASITRDPQKSLEKGRDALKQVLNSWLLSSPLEKYFSTNINVFKAEAEAVLRQALIRSRQRGQLPTQSAVINDVAFARNDRQVAVACENGTVRLWEWDPSQGETKRTEDNGNTKAPLVLNEPVSRVIFDFDEKLLAVLTGDPLGENRGKGGAYLCELRPRIQESELYDLASPKPLKGHEGPVVDAAFSQDQDGKLLATACKDGRVRVYSAPDGLLLAHTVPPSLQVSEGDSLPVNSVAFDRSDQLVVACGNVEQNDRTLLGQVCLGDLSKLRSNPPGKLPMTLTLEPLPGCELPARRAVFSPDGALIAAGCSDGSVWAWDARRKRLVARLIGHDWSVSSLEFSRDGAQLVTASGDRTARIWDASRWLSAGAESNGEVRVFHSSTTLIGHTGMVFSAAFSPIRAVVVTASADGTVRVWDARTGQELNRLIGHTGPVRVARFRVFPRSRAMKPGRSETVKPMLVATASEDGTAGSGTPDRSSCHSFD